VWRPCEQRYESIITAFVPRSGSYLHAGSLVENLNSRRRGYFFLRRPLGKDYLTLLQFFLNHRRFLRSDDPVESARVPRSC
jgi:hypothetical protein